MSNAAQILNALDHHLDTRVELTLYGRAALQLGYPNPAPEFAQSHDVDAIFWIGQAQELAQSGNFWEAVDRVNQELADQELYVSHFFQENQVILSSPNPIPHILAPTPPPLHLLPPLKTCTNSASSK